MTPPLPGKVRGMTETTMTRADCERYWGGLRKGSNAKITEDSWEIHAQT